MKKLYEEYGEKFFEVFKTITADNGEEFTGFSDLVEAWGTKVYFAHPYSSYEKPVNERHNGLLRDFVPKGESIEKYTDDEILSFADEINGRSRKLLGYHTPEELFDKQLDKIYAAWFLWIFKILFNLLLQITYFLCKNEMTTAWKQWSLVFGGRCPAGSKAGEAKEEIVRCIGAENRNG